jgi:leucyl-tRNA synthetase
MLFASAPEDDIDWADVSPTGMHKWLSRVWRLTLEHLVRVEEAGTGAGSAEALAASADERSIALRRATAHAVDAAGREYAARKYNTAIARMMELTNAVGDALRSGPPAPIEAAVREALTQLQLLLAPIAPFLTEELWRRLGGEGSVHEQVWPVADPALLVHDEVEVPVQVNGRLRGRVVVAAGTSAADLEAAARAEESVQAHLTGEIVKVIVVPDRMVNLVVRG